MDILMITDFHALEVHKDSGTPALKYFHEMLCEQYNVVTVTPKEPPRKIGWFRYVWDCCNLDCTGVQLIYGAGCTSAYIAANLGRKFGIPSVGRLYGTYLYPHLNNPIQLSIKFEETLAFKARCDKYIITNDGTRGDLVADHFGIPKEDLYFLRNGVDVIDDEVYTNDVPIIISIARLEGWKHIERIIKAFNRCLYLNAKLWIIGDGPEKDSLIQLSGGNKKIVFSGQLARRMADHCLSRADVFISTNDYSNVSNALLLAMSLGKCCVVLNSGAEIIEHGVTGLVAYDERELPALLQTAIASPGLRTKLGVNAMEYAVTHFESWDSRIQKEVGIIEELLKC